MIGGGLIEPLIRLVGVEGVSVGVLALLAAVTLYAHKASSVGATVITAGSTARHDLQVLAIVLGALLVLGVLSADTQRANELVQLGQQQLAEYQLLEKIWRVVP